MRKIALFIISLFMLQAAKANSTDTLTVRIKGMRCEECAHKVGTVLKMIDGFETVSFNLEKRTATIAYDGTKTCADTIKGRLAATKRYKTSAYSKTEVIRRGIGLQMTDMHCQNCVNRIVKRMETVEGIDSIAPHLDKKYVFFRYDANKTTKDEIRNILLGMGFTPVSYYTSKNISFAYFNIPEEQATPETIENVLTLDGVDDVNVNAKKKSLAITFVNNETSVEKLMKELKEAGIEAVVPAPHVCKEK